MMTDSPSTMKQPLVVASGVPTGVAGPSQQYAGSAAQENFVLDHSGKYKLKHAGAFAAVEVAVGPNDGLKSQGSTMVSMSDNVEITTHLEGGLGSSLLRCCCAGASLFFSHYRLLPGLGERGDVLLAPAAPGEVVMLHLDGTGPGWVVNPGGFLGCDESVSIGVKMLGLAQGCCGGEGFFCLEAGGAGRLLISSYGAITRYDLQPGEVRKVDNGYLVAWSAGMNWTIGKATKSLLTSFLSGEGLVARFTGPGTVYVQTRSLKNLANALIPYLPTTNTGGGSGDSS